MDIGKIIEYWVRSSEEDYLTARTLFENKRYAHCLFFCHLFMEKIIKAMVVKRINTHAPHDHNLLVLAGLGGIAFTAKEKNDLKEINTFNIRGRYDNYKSAFYKKATRSYAEQYLKISQKLYQWLKQGIKK